MDKKSLINYIEESFLKPLFELDGITDISYNGRDIYYVTNKYGRSKSEIVLEQSDARDFIRQLANITEKQFSFLNPILDINVGKYRINATHHSIGRVGLDEALTFSIRIASITRKIKHDHSFIESKIEDFFDCLILNHISIVISGVPGVGKTEFQKYLISRMKDNERILVIDNTIELAYVDDTASLDMTFWQADERNKISSISSLIKNGLRNNPDWMIISEARGEDMNDVLNSAMTGIPIITTIHSFDAFSSINRMARMVMQGNQHIDYQDVVENIGYHFRVYVHLRKTIDNKDHIKRYISSIVVLDNDGKQFEIYKNDSLKTTFKALPKGFVNLLSNKSIKLVEGFSDYE